MRIWISCLGIWSYKSISSYNLYAPNIIYFYVSIKYKRFRFCLFSSFYSTFLCQNVYREWNKDVKALSFVVFCETRTSTIEIVFVLNSVSWNRFNWFFRKYEQSIMLHICITNMKFAYIQMKFVKYLCLWIILIAWCKLSFCRCCNGTNKWNTSITGASAFSYSLQKQKKKWKKKQ